MKKFLSLLLSITMLLSITAGLDLTAYAQTLTGSCGENVTYTLDTDSGLLTISGTGPMTDYLSTSSIPWYSNRSSVKTVEIGYGVTSIGVYAFYYCSSLTSVTIPDSVTSIGSLAFEYCINLTSVTIPNSVTSIGEWAFAHCSSLTSVTIPNSVTSIGNYAFEDCSSLTSVTVDSNNQNYSSQDGVLFNKEKTTLIQYPIGNTRTSYTIPNSVTSIGEYAFYNCSNLTSVTIPDSVTSIGDDAFYYCSSLTSATIPNSVTIIGDDAFAYCSSLTSVIIPNSVTSIGNCAFAGCSSLTSVTIPNSVTSIGDGAFDCCGRLTSVTIPNSVTSIGQEAFYGCSSLTSVTIPNSVTSIGECAFENCSSLTSVTIPDSVTSIGDWEFAGCSSLTSITVDSDNQYYSSQDGILFNKDKTTLIQYPIGNTRASYTIPDSVTSIGEDAFAGCSSLTNIAIPNSVTSIGDYAFDWCNSLTSVTIPNSVTSIGNYAFYYCDSLTDVYYAGTKEQWNSISIGQFNECLTDATIHYNSHEHIYSDVITPPSCTAQGYTTHTCTICGDSYVDSNTNPTGHKYDSGKVTKSATCTSTGIKTYTCTVCGATKTETIAKKAHTPVTDKAVAATCTKTGKTQGSHCSVCGTVITAQKTVAKKAHTYKTYTTKATTSKNGSIVTKCSVCGAVKSKSTIYYPKTITLSTTSYTYNGSVKKPTVKVVGSNGKTISSSNYTVTYASGRKNVGKYAVKITFKGNYSGTKTLYFTIKPKVTSISSLTAGSKKFTVKWKKLTTQTTGYQIQYSTSSKFTNAKTVTVSKNSTTSKTVSKLSSKKKYYVRVRTYKTVNGTKYYSSWSSAKSVTTK